MKQITTAEFPNAISQGIVLIDFFAERCGPCKMIAPYLDQMSEQLGETVQFYKIDVDAEQELTAQQEVNSMPTLKIFKNGSEFQTIVGADLQGVWNGLQSALQDNNQIEEEFQQVA